MSAVCLLGGWEEEEEEEEDGGRNENRLISHARCTPRQKKRGGGSFASLSKKNIKRKGTTKGLSSICLTVYRKQTVSPLAYFV